MLAVSKTLGLDSDCIPHIASGLGAGIGGQGEVCGALTGGVLILGLTHGRRRAEDIEAKNKTYSKVGELVNNFAAANGAVRCRDLIGLDLTSDEGVLEFYAQNMQEEKCNRIVKNAVTAILELLDE